MSAQPISDVHSELEETQAALCGHRAALTAQRRGNAQLTGEVSRLRQAGDALQSEASRLAGWVRRAQEDGAISLPYEEEMALLGTLDAVEAWTRARRRTEHGPEGKTA